MSSEWVGVSISLVALIGVFIAWIPGYIKGIVRNEIRASRLHELEKENERLRKYAEQSK